jgi:hypothetical protein
MKKILCRLQAEGGNFFTEHALGIVITVVIGVIIFVAMNLVFKDMVIPGIKEKITSLFLSD